MASWVPLAATQFCGDDEASVIRPVPVSAIQIGNLWSR
jgi:hypothetical protein